MPDEIAARPIRHIQFSGETEAGAISLAITDDSGETHAYAVTPGTLRAFLAPMLSLAVKWAGDPELSFEGIGGTQNALIAKRIMFARGRDDTEAAVRVFMGKDLDLTFLLPLGSLMPAFQAFAKNVTRTDPKLN